MSDKNALNQYITQDVMTSSPEKLVFMLYDKAITSLREAIKSIEAEDIERRYKANKKATDIIMHMWQTLDMEKGGEIAVNLDRLFSFILNKLPKVDMDNDPEPAREVIKLLEPLHESWKQLAMQKPAQGAASPQAESSTAAPAAPSTQTVTTETKTEAPQGGSSKGKPQESGVDLTKSGVSISA